MNATVAQVTQQIINRSAKTRNSYLERMKLAHEYGVNRKTLGCSNIAHAMAAMNDHEKELIIKMTQPNVAIVSAYNDMLSAHEPYKLYPALIKRTLADLGATAQVAGGVPAMCDGVTQSQPGMELSLFSRDNIAMGSAIALSHNVFDGAMMLGVCDKIVPGLLIGALSFGHLPFIFVPAGPMNSGISNAQKAKIRQEYAAGKAGADALMQVEAASYHSSGTCTFYGTANSNQMLLEIMGLQLPNSSFINANTPLREALSAHAAKVMLDMIQQRESKAISHIIDERSFVNAIVGLMATGGSTNHAIHLIAIAKTAGIIVNWDDFDAISRVVPLLCKMYPNGQADVNHFRDAGGMSVVINELLHGGFLHNDVQTIIGQGLKKFVVEPILENGVQFIDGPKTSKNETIIASIAKPFNQEGGLRLLQGNIGRSIIKTSALKNEYFLIEAPAEVFNSQEELQEAFKAGQLEKDFIAVVRYQGPKANGMPELHGLMPPLGLLQDKGYKVAIVTDGRMSGASGKVPSAIHMVPEAIEGGVLAQIKSGDIIRFDVHNNSVSLLTTQEELASREICRPNLEKNNFGFGRELFGMIRANVSNAEEGASIF